MKKSGLFTVALLCILFFTVPASAQGIKIGLGGGLTSVQSPDVFTKDINDGGLGYAGEYHYGLKVKVSLPLIPLTPYGHVTYHKFNGEGSTIVGKIETSQSLLQIGVGAEMSLVPGPISPYFAFEIAMNDFGDAEITAPLIAGGNQTIKGESRFGAALGIGTEINILPVLNFDVSAKYNWFNLVGKDDGEETVGAITLNVLVMFSAL